MPKHHELLRSNEYPRSIFVALHLATFEEEELNSAFDKCDQNGDGVLSRDEVTQILTENKFPLTSRFHSNFFLCKSCQTCFVII